jgi:hypothetical protein
MACRQLLLALLFDAFLFLPESGGDHLFLACRVRAT